MFSSKEMELRIQVEELLSRYCRIVDCKDYGKFSEIFTPDVRIRVAIQDLNFEDIRSFTKFLEKTKPFSEDRRHVTSNLSVRIHGKRLEAFAYWDSIMTFKDHPIVEGGWYVMGCSVGKGGSLKFDTFKIYHKYRTKANVRSWKEVGFPGMEIKISKDSDIFQELDEWF